MRTIIPLPHSSRFHHHGARALPLLLAVCLLLSGIGPWRTTAGAASLSIPREEGLPWELRSETLEYDTKSDTYTAKNGVMIRKGDIRLSADRVWFNRREMLATAEGNVVLTSGEDVLAGHRVELDLRTDTGRILDGSVFMSQKHFYIKGHHLEKINEDTYIARKASLTSCDGLTPDWKITGETIETRVEGYGTVTHAAFWIRDIPVFYVPWFIFPAKSERQSGLLLPEGGVSDRRGFDVLQPFYWAIDDQSDATLNVHYMSQRGTRLGLEYRFVGRDDFQAAAMLDLLKDRKVDDGAGGSSADWGYTDDGYSRSNHDRYWFRMKTDAPLPAGFMARLDLDWVSDQDYLKEFKGGAGGFDHTEHYFEDRFGRELDDYDDSVRANRLNLVGIRSDYSINAGLLFYDSVTQRRWSDEDNTLHQLPRINVDTLRSPIAGTPLFWRMDSDYAYFYRIDGNRGHRLDLAPRLAWPVTVSGGLFLEPSVGFRQTLWYVDRLDRPNADAVSDKTDNDRYRHRELADLRLDMSTRLFRVFQFREPSSSQVPGFFTLPEAIRHDIRPRLTYELVPDVDQSDLPDFVADEWVTRKNRFTLSLVHTFDTRTMIPDRAPLIRRMGRLEVGQSYEFNDRDADEPILPVGQSWNSDPETGEHLSPLFARADLYPTRFLSLSADTRWSHRSGEFLSRNTALSLFDNRGDRFSIEHRYQWEGAESLRAAFRAALTDSLSLYGEYERDLSADSEIQSGFGVSWQSQCWSANLLYTREENDHSLGLWITLLGLGRVGTD